MKNKSIIYLFLYLFFLGSCTDNNKRITFDNMQQIECVSIPYSDILGISMQLLLKDSLLLINDFYGDSLIHILDIKNNYKHKKLVAKGNGPNEFISPIAIYMTNDNLYLYERQTFRLFSMPIDMLLYENKEIKNKFKTDARTMMLFPLSDSMFVSSTSDGTKPFNIYNSNGEKMREFGEYPAYWHKEVDLPNRVRAFYHQTFFEKHPSQKMFVAYSGHVLGIYKYESIYQDPILRKEILLSNYNYKFIDNGTLLTAERDDDVERGILTVACSANYIYMVYNPNKKGGEDMLSHQIKIIDWNGNPIKQLNINKQATCLVIDEIEEKGYIIANDPEDTLMYFYL